jgi:hypothetical protein
MSDWYKDPRRLWIARAYAAAKHEPDEPAVFASYSALIAETSAQAALIPVRVLFTPDDPYMSGIQMLHEVARTGILRIWTGGSPPVDHPLYGLNNWLFRAVHDWFGHFVPHNLFDAQGEENAFRAHVAMYSAAARPALATETRGQNCWSNFGPHLTRADSREAYDSLPVDRPFAPQKATLLPSWAWRY